MEQIISVGKLYWSYLKSNLPVLQQAQAHMLRVYIHTLLIFYSCQTTDLLHWYIISLSLWKNLFTCWWSTQCTRAKIQSKPPTTGSYLFIIITGNEITRQTLGWRISQQQKYYIISIQFVYSTRLITCNSPISKLA